MSNPDNSYASVSTKPLSTELTQKELLNVSGGLKLMYRVAIAGGITSSILIPTIGVANTVRLTTGAAITAVCKVGINRGFHDAPIIHHMFGVLCAAAAFVVVTQYTNVTFPVNVYNYLNVTKS